MRILVTGSLGVIGSHLVPELRDRGHEVYGTDIRHDAGSRYMRCDVSHSRQVDQALKLSGPDVVYHLAAEFGRLNGEDYFEQLWDTNAIGTRNVLEACVAHGAKLVLASSSEVYGTHEGLLTEDAMDRYEVRQPNDYAISKWVNEQQTMNFVEQRGLQAIRLRFFNTYGPGEPYHPFRSVVSLFCHHALSDIPFTVYGGSERDFTYIDDFIPTLANVAEVPFEGQAYNIGGGESRRIEDLAALVLDDVGCSINLAQHVGGEPFNRSHKKPDISRARAELGHDPKTTLEEGVPAYLDWLAEEYDLPRHAPLAVRG